MFRRTQQIRTDLINDHPIICGDPISGWCLGPLKKRPNSFGSLGGFRKRGRVSWCEAATNNINRYIILHIIIVFDRICECQIAHTSCLDTLWQWNINLINIQSCTPHVSVDIVLYLSKIVGQVSSAILFLSVTDDTQAWICLKRVAPSSFQKNSCFTLIQYLSRRTISPFHLNWTTRGRIFWDPTSLPQKTTLSKQSRQKFRLGFPDFWSTKVSTGSGHGLPRTWRLFQCCDSTFLFQKSSWSSSKLQLV